MKWFCAIFFCLVFSFPDAQVHGLVTDEFGDSLAFTSVYVKGTTEGTTTNTDGIYTIELTPGTYRLVFQYIGYQKKTVQVNVENEPQRLDVVLERENIILKEVEVKAESKDPAYAIIRKAIDKRKYFRDQVVEFSCRSYIKGVVEFLDAPDQIMGKEIGDIGGILDTNRQGIVYLSESESTYHFKQPGERKELMISSKVSGSDTGFSFNRAADMDFDLYENHITIGRQIMSPIASNAFSYYRYRLEGAFFDEDGLLINKIRVIPKREEDPVFRGVIYIVEDLWCLQSVELHLTGPAMKQPVFDTLTLTQVFVPVEDPDIWRVFSRSISFKLKFFGFRLGGNFTGIFSEYNLNPAHGKGFFSNEIFKVEKDAIEKSQEYWDETRPVPLTVEEEKDYVRKDSLKEIWESKAFMDSLDTKNNKFTPLDILTGYSYDNSFKKWSINFPSPLTTFQFNPVQGVVLGMSSSFRKEFDEFGSKWVSISPGVSYGFSDEKIRWKIRGAFRINRKNFSRVTLEGGNVAAQFSSDQPVPLVLNTFRALFRHDNFLKLYERKYAKIEFRRELVNGIFMWTSFEYNKRNPLVNHSNYSFRDRDEEVYNANDPLDPFNYGIPFFESHEALVFQVHVRFRFSQKYISYPDRKFILGSDIPDLLVSYKKGGFGKDAKFDFLSLRMQEKGIELGLVGKLDLGIEWGTFIGNSPTQFIDYKHFNGNQFNVANPSNYLGTFLLLPYFERSTDQQYFEAHMQHHFDGFILDKLPVLRKLGFTTVLKSDWMHTKPHGHYGEVAFGIENFGISILRNMRLDFVKSFGDNYASDFGIVFGIGL